MISWHTTTERNSGLSLPQLLRSVRREYERSLIITFWRDVNLLLFGGGGLNVVMKEKTSGDRRAETDACSSAPPTCDGIEHQR